MGKQYAYSDPHFGHQGIISSCNRPWVSVDQMDEDLIKLFNSVVTNEDTTYFLGDITLKGSEKLSWLRRIITKMHGTKILIFGNHDRWRWPCYIEAGFQSCHSYLSLGTHVVNWPADDYSPFRWYDKHAEVVMCHDPAWAQDNSKLWLCGHLHTIAYRPASHVVNVSVEQTNYKPILINDILNGWAPPKPKLE